MGWGWGGIWWAGYTQAAEKLIKMATLCLDKAQAKVYMGEG